MPTKPDPASAAHQREFEALLEGQKLGMDQAVQMMRDGNLRLSPLPFEKGERPYTSKLRPVKATILVWKAWWREVLHGGY